MDFPSHIPVVCLNLPRILKMSDFSVFQPTPEHEWLTRHVGQWEVECSYFTIPGDDPLEVSGEETTEMLGPFWVVGRFEADMMGTPVIGQAVTGFDPVKKLFTGTWKDNYTPFHYTFAGTLSDDKKLLKLEGENYDPTRGKSSLYRSRSEYPSDSKRITKLSVEVDGVEVPILEYRYRRK